MYVVKSGMHQGGACLISWNYFNPELISMRVCVACMHTCMCACACMCVSPRLLKLVTLCSVIWTQYDWLTSSTAFTWQL